MQACGSRREVRQIVKLGKKIQMNQKETFDSTVKNHHLNPLVSFDAVMISFTCGSISGPKMFERWVVKRDSPILGRAPDQTYLWSLCCCVLFDPSCLLPLYHFGFTFGFALGLSYQAAFATRS